MNAVLSSPSMPYGAPDLQRAARPHMIRALLLSSVLVITIFALALTLSPFHPKAGERVIEIPPPSYTTEVFRIPAPPAPALQPPVAAVRPAPARAVPQVVPDPPAVTAPPSEGRETGTDKGAPPSELREGTGSGEAQAGDGPVNLPGEIAFVEHFPVPIRKVTPVYPTLAREAGVEGTVMVYVLVGKNGLVRETKLHAEKHAPMLDAAALEAARAWTFEPALSNGRPVAVWVSLPFKFSLR